MNISLTRGDTLKLKVTLTTDDGEYILKPGDKLVFTLKESVYSEKILLQKEIVDNHFVIEHLDTNELSYGKYVYDIQLTTSNKEVYTVVKPSTFEITDEVTYGS